MNLPEIKPLEVNKSKAGDQNSLNLLVLYISAADLCKIYD